MGLNLIKQAPPDGHTLGCGQGGNMVIVPLAYDKVSNDTVKDFAPVALVASNFLALVVHPDVPLKTTEDLINYAKANPGKATFGTNGEGVFLHFATELFSRQAGFSYLHVPYKTVSASMTEILGGQINASLTSFNAVQPFISSGKVRVLGLARTTRSPDYPKVPTLSEAVSGFTSCGWFGVIAPAGMPKENHRQHQPRHQRSAETAGRQAAHKSLWLGNPHRATRILQRDHPQRLHQMGKTTEGHGLQTHVIRLRCSGPY